MAKLKKLTDKEKRSLIESDGTITLSDVPLLDEIEKTTTKRLYQLLRFCPVSDHFGMLAEELVRKFQKRRMVLHECINMINKWNVEAARLNLSIVKEVPSEEEKVSNKSTGSKKLDKFCNQRNPNGQDPANQAHQYLIIEEEKQGMPEPVNLIDVEKKIDQDHSPLKVPELSASDIAQVYGSKQFQFDSIRYLTKHGILQDLANKKRAFTKKASKMDQGARIVNIGTITKNEIVLKKIRKRKQNPLDEAGNDAYAAFEEPIEAPAIFHAITSKADIQLRRI